MKRADNLLKMLSLDTVGVIDKQKVEYIQRWGNLYSVLFSKILRLNPQNPTWINRDRLVVSPQGNYLLLASLYLSGFKISLDDLKKISSLPANEVDWSHFPGVEVTVNHPGENIATAVGMALAEQYLAQIYNQKKSQIIDYKIIVVCDLQDLKSGIAHESLGLVRKFSLNNLVLIVTDDEKTDYDYLEASLEGYDFDVLKLYQAHKKATITSEVSKALKAKFPTAIIARNESKQPAWATIDEARLHLGVSTLPFEVLKSDKASFEVPIKKRWQAISTAWSAKFRLASQTKLIKPELIAFGTDGQVNFNFDSANFRLNATYTENLIKSNEDLIAMIQKKSPFSLGIFLGTSSEFKGKSLPGRILTANGIPNAAGYLLNGIGLSKIKGYLIMEHADDLCCFWPLKMSKRLNLPVTYIFNRAFGADYLGDLRRRLAVPIIRPADINEMIGAWEYILTNDGPHILMLDDIVVLRLETTKAKSVEKGAYLIKNPEREPKATIVCSGGVLSIVNQISLTLEANGYPVRLVSLPCIELFLNQNLNYQKLLGDGTTLTIVVSSSDDLNWFNLVSKAKQLIILSKPKDFEVPVLAKKIIALLSN